MTAAVTPLEARCEVCKDTGSKSQDLNGDLDCHNCQAALERIELRGTMRRIGVKNGGGTSIDGMNWRAYQLGKNSTQSDAYDAQYVALNRIDMHDGAWLEKESKTGDWLFKRNSGFERYLNEFEAGFVNAAVAAKVSAAPVVPVAAQPVVQQEPVAYMAFAKNENVRIWAGKNNLGAKEAAEAEGLVLQPVYAAPSLEAKPVGEVIEKLIAALQDCARHPRGIQRANIVRKAIAMAQGDKA